jgi:hypothetical protein
MISTNRGSLVSKKKALPEKAPFEYKFGISNPDNPSIICFGRHVSAF